MPGSPRWQQSGPPCLPMECNLHFCQAMFWGAANLVMELPAHPRIQEPTYPSWAESRVLRTQQETRRPWLSLRGPRSTTSGYPRANSQGAIRCRPNLTNMFACQWNLERKEQHEVFPPCLHQAPRGSRRADLGKNPYPLRLLPASPGVCRFRSQAGILARRT